MDIKMLNKTINALDWLIDECETNYIFGEDANEMRALDNAKNIVHELHILRDRLLRDNRKDELLGML